MRAEGIALPDYTVIEEAMDKNIPLVKETGSVNNLLIDNLGDVDLFIQAGNIVKGGLQDRTFGVDFIVPARSTNVPVPVFCVESRRWGKRRSESESAFSISKDFVASKKIRAAISRTKDQGEVWSLIHEHQEKLAASIGKPVRAAASPSSLQLSYEMEETARARKQYADVLDNLKVPEDATGVVWAINGKPSHADIYAHARLFRQVWHKLQRAAAIEALEQRIFAAKKQEAAEDTPTATAEDILKWLDETAQGTVEEENTLPPRTRLKTQRTKSQVRFDTLDTQVGDVPVHITVLAD